MQTQIANLKNEIDHLMPFPWKNIDEDIVDANEKSVLWVDNDFRGMDVVIAEFIILCIEFTLRNYGK